MRERFDLEFEIVEDGASAGARRRPGHARTPRSRRSRRSTRFARPPIVEALAEGETRFDLVVVDESHACRTRRPRLTVSASSCRVAADHMLMLSATPLSLGTHNLYHQLSILVPDEFFDVVEFDGRIAAQRAPQPGDPRLAGTAPNAAAAGSTELGAIRELRARHSSTGTRCIDEVCARLATLDGDVDDEARFELCDGSTS